MDSGMSTEAVETILRERPLTETNRAQLATVANSLPPSELDYLMDSMPVADAAELFRVLHPELALEVFEDLPDSQQADLVEELGVEDSTALIAELDPDDRAAFSTNSPTRTPNTSCAGWTPPNGT